MHLLSWFFFYQPICDAQRTAEVSIVKAPSNTFLNYEIMRIRVVLLEISQPLRSLWLLRLACRLYLLVLAEVPCLSVQYQSSRQTKTGTSLRKKLSYQLFKLHEVLETSVKIILEETMLYLINVRCMYFANDNLSIFSQHPNPTILKTWFPTEPLLNNSDSVFNHRSKTNNMIIVLSN